MIDSGYNSFQLPKLKDKSKGVQICIGNLGGNCQQTQTITLSTIQQWEACSGGRFQVLITYIPNCHTSHCTAWKLEEKALICNYTPSCMHSVRPSQTGTRLQRHNENPVASSKLIQEDHGDMTRVTDAMENNPRFTHFFCHMTEPQSHLYFTVCFSKPIWRTTQTHNNCKTKEHPT